MCVFFFFFKTYSVKTKTTAILRKDVDQAWEYLFLINTKKRSSYGV